VSDHAPPNELRVEVDLDALPSEGRTFRLEADAAARAAIAKRLRVLSFEALTGDIHLVATPSEFAARGVLRAAVMRECVASLEPFTERIEDGFAVDFQRATEDARAIGTRRKSTPAPFLTLANCSCSNFPLRWTPFRESPTRKVWLKPMAPRRRRVPSPRLRKNSKNNNKVNVLMKNTRPR